MKGDLRGIKLFLLDMDGTVYVGGRLLSGAREALSTIRKSGRRLCFLTNNSSRSREMYLKKLSGMGISASNEEIFTSADATLMYLKRFYSGKSVYLLGTEGLKGEFLRAGIVLSDDADIVVVGYDTELTYKKLTTATDLINRGAVYICTHSDVNCPAEPYYVPDVGSFIELIYKSTGRRPDVICGKPFQAMCDAVVEKFGLQPNEIAMVGDRLSTDIAFGNVGGFASILVLSGETTEEMYNRSEIKADLVIKGIYELDEMLRGLE